MLLLFGRLFGLFFCAKKIIVITKLPIVLQNIREVLLENYAYVDKTSHALNLIQGGKHYLLLRPRRFGKFLFVSTLAEVFRGNKELFKDCATFLELTLVFASPFLC